MLVALSIRSFVLIDRLDLEPGDGFTALTGETGAGKSIILDALGLALGGAAERRFVRSGSDRARVVAEFAPPPDHPAWGLLDEADLELDRSETLTLARTVARSGPSRAYINDQPVSASLLARVGGALVEIHGQHAAAGLLKPSSHRDLLDRYAGNEALRAACAEAWATYCAARDHHAALAAERAEAEAETARLEADLADLDALAPETGEVAALEAQRAGLVHQERIGQALETARGALDDGDVEGALARAMRAAERIRALPGLAEAGGGLASASEAAASALERALIEVEEARRALADLDAAAEHEPGRLDAVERRLHALRTASTRQGVAVEDLPQRLIDLRDRLALVAEGDRTLADAAAAETAARADWRCAADRLSTARQVAAGRLEQAVAGELAPLRMARTRLRVVIAPLEEADAGARGTDRVSFEVETTPGAGFGPLRQIASGGELARFSLAMACALAEAGGSSVQVFDEADQGVGGAVAAAVGERLARLGTGRQVFAVTHSPQVAAAARGQWRIAKRVDGKGLGRTDVQGLDDRQRLEEIARMLSGADVTPEARGAAARLLEVGCRSPSPSNP